MTAANALPLEGGMNFEALRVRPLDDDEMASIEGGAGWMAVAGMLGWAAAFLVIGVAVGVAVYYYTN